VWVATPLYFCELSFVGSTFSSQRNLTSQTLNPRGTVIILFTSTISSLPKLIGRVMI
jgi:hypothetical protein